MCRGSHRDVSSGLRANHLDPMAYPVFLQGKADGSGCCDCATQVDCGCPIPIPPSARNLFCQTKGGIATLRGWQEFCGFVSSPPKFFTEMAFGGTITETDYLYLGESPLACKYQIGLYTITQSGSCVMDPATGAITSSAAWSEVRNGTPTSGSIACTEPVGYCAAGYGTPCYGFCAPLHTSDFNKGVNRYLTSTNDQLIGNEQCSPGDSYELKTIGNITATLSSEDTDEAALARLESSSSWGSWFQIGSGSHGCDASLTDNPPETCCLARYESRGGATFTHFDENWKITASGLVPNKAYSTKLSFYRSVYNVGSYSLYETITVGAISDGSGNLLIQGSVPNVKGYDTYATF